VTAPHLGPAGAVYGWAVNGGVSILISAAWGIQTGEWKNAGRLASIWALAAVVLFISSFVILASAQ